ncbi:MAG: hypothetical protein JXR12_19070, partial [Neptunomonas phycophila]|uniref:hypothetical protein n=1 Tax=Neptunomonas phycophila TaxID=1572645 RepID=UPI003B8D0D3E
KCNEVFEDIGDFQGHSCVTQAMAKPRDQLLKDLLESGGCSQEYYDREMNKIKLSELVDQSIISFTLTDGTVVQGETASNIRHELVSTHKVRGLPQVGTAFGLMLNELGLTKGTGKRDGAGRKLDIYYKKG